MSRKSDLRRETGSGEPRSSQDITESNDEMVVGSENVGDGDTLFQQTLMKKHADNQGKLLELVEREF